MGIEAYLPLRKEIRQWSDRKKWVEVPIINSYIFIRIAPKDYRKVFDVKHIVAYVSYKRKAVPIPDNEIAAMQRMVEQKISFGVEKSEMKKGKIITITSGPLIGVKGEITEIKGEKKLYMRVQNAGFTLVVNLDESVTYE